MLPTLLLLAQISVEAGPLLGYQVDSSGGRGSAGFSTGYVLGAAVRGGLRVGTVSFGLGFDLAGVSFRRQYGYEASLGWRADLVVDARVLLGSSSTFEHGPSVGVIVRRTSPEQLDPAYDPSFVNYGLGVWYSTTWYSSSTESKLGYGQRTGCQVGMSGLSENHYGLDTRFYSCDATVFVVFHP